MEYSDSDNGSDGDGFIDDLLGPEDLFNDEADEDRGDIQSDNDGGEDDRGETDGTTKDLEEKKEKKIKPKRIVKNPRVKLNYDTLTGPNGLSVLKKLFKNFKFKGSGHEKEDLTKIMSILQQWVCYRLCPSYDFESCLAQLEALGRKKNVQTYMKKFRMGMDEWGENRSDDDGDNNKFDSIGDVEMSDRNEDFDILLNEPVTNVDTGSKFSPGAATPSHNDLNQTQSTQNEAEITLTQEQLERIARNRKLAEERRLKRMSEQQQQQQERMEVTETQTVNRDSEISLDRMNLDDHN